MIWFVVILSVIAVLAITLLLFLEMMGDDVLRYFNIKHNRGEYINDQTAVIYQTIKDTENSAKSYSIFVEYIFTNHKQFLSFVVKMLKDTKDQYGLHDYDGLRKIVRATEDMKVELKDQKCAETECLNSIDPALYIETAAWFCLSDNCRFGVNDGLRRMAQVCIDYDQYYSEPFQDVYREQLEYLVSDICSSCETTIDLISSGDIEGMRELRKRMEIILSESYANTQRLYELLHDGRSRITPEQRIALQYVMNAFQELHCMIYTLRRFVLANICITLSLSHSK